MGLIHIYCGDGKGKTTASVGLSVRAAGSGLNVVFAQFLKSTDSGELHVLSKLDNVKILRSQKEFPFTDTMTPQQKEEIVGIHNEIFQTAVKSCTPKDVLVLDELMATYNYNLIDRELVDDYFANPDEKPEVIMTGRDPAEHFVNLADYVSEVKKIKHPFDKGKPARKGIEM